MLLQTRGWELSLLVLVLAGVGLVSYWVYRDADARGMDDAPYWGAAVGVAAVVGIIVGGLVAVGVYLSTRPDTYAGSERPFDAMAGRENAGVDGTVGVAGTTGADGTAGGDGSAAADGTADVDRTTDPAEPTDPAHADLPPVPALTAERVADASETTLRGYARRYDRLDATGDPDAIRAALVALVEADETDRLGETVEEAESDDNDGIYPTGTDHRRHAARPQLRRESGTSASPRSSEDGGRTVSTVDSARTDDDTREFEWVEEA